MPRALQNDEDGDAEGSASASLLAGPRNVKPYIARRGEQYMNKEQLEHFATILRSWKRDLMVEVDRTVLHMKDEAANPPDPNDRATLESEFALELRTRDRERKLIRKIEEALSRIEDGSYGYCVETGEPIGEDCAETPGSVSASSGFRVCAKMRPLCADPFRTPPSGLAAGCRRQLPERPPSRWPLAATH